MRWSRLRGLYTRTTNVWQTSLVSSDGESHALEVDQPLSAVDISGASAYTSIYTIYFGGQGDILCGRMGGSRTSYIST
jgi:hypothetical protein